MARYTPSFLVSQVSGKIGGVVFSPSKTSQTIRGLSSKRSITNERLSYIRSYTPQLIRQFNFLPENIKQAWRDRAILFPVLDRFGNKIYLNAQMLFVKANINRLLVFDGVLTSPPELHDYPLVPSYEVIYDPGQLEIAFNTSIDLTGYYLFVYASRPVSPGINSVGKNEYSYIQTTKDFVGSGFNMSVGYEAKFGPEPYPSGYKVFVYFFLLPLNFSALPSTKFYQSTNF